MCIVVDSRIAAAGSRQKPTVCKRRKAAVLGALGRVPRTPPGSESGACHQRGHSGTWEGQDAPWEWPDRGAGVENLRAQQGGVVLGPGWECRRGSHQGLGERGTTEGRRDGVVAVGAEPSTEGLRARPAGREGGELRPKGPTGGKATPGSTFCWEERGETLRGHQPSPPHSSG